MKKLFLAFAASVFVLGSCTTTEHVSFQELEIDYPSSMSIINQDQDEDSMTIQFDNAKNDVDFLVIDIFKDDPGAYQSADPDMLASYLSYHAYQLLDGFAISSENVELEEEYESEDDIPYLSEEGEDPLSGTIFEGTFHGKHFYGEVLSTIIGDYRVSAYAQATTEDELDKFFEKIFFTAHLK